MAATSNISSQAQMQEVKASRLWWVGPLAIVASIVANLIIRTIAVAVLGASADFPPLGWAPPIMFTIIGVLGATVLFAAVTRLSKQPIALFRGIAVVVLLLSFVPDVLLLTSNAMPGTSLLGVLALILMHTVTCVITLTLFARLTSE